MYSIIRNLLFLLDAEKAHTISLKLLSILNKIGLVSLLFKKTIDAPITVMGIQFKNKVGLAAGLDKNANHIAALAQCGFGFIEVGTVTPVAQAGNPKPRLFRLQVDNAIINRMGFNNGGVASLIKNIKKTNTQCVLGINIGKNKNTTLENAVDDYLIGLRAVYLVADYITVNISSPNTPGLRELQTGEKLTNLLMSLKKEQAILAKQQAKYVPLVVKIAPDLTDNEIQHISKQLLNTKIDGIIVSNTTNARLSTLQSNLQDETGGLSGAPLFEPSTKVVKKIAKALNGKIPIIAAGGIFCAQDAKQKIEAGASLVQIYTGFIYQGPYLIYQCAKKLSEDI